MKLISVNSLPFNLVFFSLEIHSITMIHARNGSTKNELYWPLPNSGKSGQLLSLKLQRKFWRGRVPLLFLELSSLLDILPGVRALILPMSSSRKDLYARHFALIRLRWGPHLLFLGFHVSIILDRCAIIFRKHSTFSVLHGRVKSSQHAR